VLTSARPCTAHQNSWGSDFIREAILDVINDFSRHALCAITERSYLSLTESHLIQLSAHARTHLRRSHTHTHTHSHRSHTHARVRLGMG
jgi:hypothetical protein